MSTTGNISADIESFSVSFASSSNVMSTSLISSSWTALDQDMLGDYQYIADGGGGVSGGSGSGGYTSAGGPQTVFMSLEAEI
jgi:hypothetical protein